MAKTLSKTLTHGDFASVFQEVQQPETVGWTTEGELRLFHLVIRNNKINVEDLKAYLYTSMGDYVFSRAKLEKFSQAGNRDAVVSQALRILKKNGGADVQGTGSELGEVLNYTFMEEKLHAPKLMSRVEISTDGKQFDSVADSIHLLTSSVSGRPYHQVVFGSSNIVGDLGYAIDGAFEKICRIEQHEVQEIHMANQLIFERMATKEEAALVKDILLPNPSKTNKYNTSYGVFLGYTLGLGKDYPVHEYEELAEQKMQADIKRYIPYILQKIQDCGLEMHSFYIYVLPFNDAEEEKKSIMEAVLEGDVDLI